MDENVQGASAQLATEPVLENQQPAEQKSAPTAEQQEHNWREARRSLEEKDRRIQELEYQARLLAQAQAQAQLAAQQRAQAQEDDIFKGRDDDDILTVSEARKLAKRLEEKSSRSPINPEDMMRIRVRDYDEVVSVENVKTYLENNPSLVELVKRSENPYATAYELIKGFKKVSGSHTMPKQAVDDKKLEAIAQKPKSPNSVFADSKAGNSMSTREQIEARRAEALKRASKYLGSI